MYAGAVTRSCMPFAFDQAIASVALALSAHTPWVQLSHVGACWLTGLGFRHT